MKQLRNVAIDTVRAWLEQCGASFIEPEATEEGRAAGYELDFMMLQPFPLAIEVVPSSGSQTARMKARRFLAQRISLADRFGRFLPVVVISDKPEELHAWSYFADAVFAVSDLPELDSLRARMEMNRGFQQILERGDPGTVRFSTDEEVENRWRDSVTLADLVSEGHRFPGGSLAEALHRALIRHREVEGYRDIGREMQDPRPHAWMIHRTNWTPVFEGEFDSFVENRCGGKVVKRRLRNDDRSIMTCSVWESPGRTQAVVRRQSVAPQLLHHKVRELVGEGWMIRASADFHPDRQILLLGIGGGDDPRISKLTGAAQQSSGWIPPLHQLNILEGAGWTVCPWDFANEEPYFIKRLKEVTND